MVFLAVLPDLVLGREGTVVTSLGEECQELGWMGHLKVATAPRSLLTRATSSLLRVSGAWDR